MTIQTLDLLVSVMGIFMVLALWHFLWCPLVVAHLRQDIFDARDYLFDLVVNRETSLNFDSDVYKGTREDLNRMIRFSHKLSLFTVLIARVFIPQSKVQYIERIATVRMNLTEEENKVILNVDKMQSRALRYYLLSSSPLMWSAIRILNGTGCVLYF